MKLLLLLLLSTTTHAQTWHKATEYLRIPERDPTEGHAEGTVAWINAYDTVQVIYQRQGSDSLFTGYKKVYRFNGYYIDLKTTYMIFFDDRNKRIETISRYYFK